MTHIDFTVPTLLLDKDGRPIDILQEVPNSLEGAVIVIASQGVEVDKHGFPTLAGLEAWHRANNPQLFEEEG